MSVTKIIWNTACIISYSYLMMEIVATSMTKEKRLSLHVWLFALNGQP